MFVRKFLFVGLFLAMTFPAYGLSSQQQSLLQNIEKYLNGITTLTAKFLQIDATGESSTGDLYILRPGKLRWEYHQPIPILVVVNGSLLSYYDQELKQTSHGSSNNNLVGFLARKNISFNQDVVVKDVILKSGAIKVKINQAAHNINLIFNDKPIYLKKMEIFDEMGNITSIALSEITHGIKLDPALFKANQLKK